MIKSIKNNLKELGFSSNEIKVYIALTQLGEATASQIAKKSDIPRTTAISILNKMKDDNYLTVHKYRGTTYFWIESPKTLADSFEHRKEIADQLAGSLTDLYRTESTFPQAQIFDTKTSIKKFIESTINKLEKKSTIYTIDTPEAGNYAKIYSDTLNQKFLELKRRRQVLTKTLVPYGTFEKINIQKLKAQNIEVREMPHGIKFEASLWIMKDMVVHFSGKPPFVVAIKHDVITPGIKSVYDYLWNTSQKQS